MVVGKSKFSFLDRPGTIDYKSIKGSTSVEVTSEAIAVLRQHRPEVMVIHLPTVDTVGHAKGWGSSDQLSAVAEADQCLGAILATLDELDVRGETFLLISSDHGGAGRGHGPEDVRSRTIPWIVAGPGIRKGYDLTRLGSDTNIETYDTFTTTCTMLGIPLRRRVTGKFVAGILEERELMAPTSAPVGVSATRPAARSQD
jgi:hypothetical protein